MKLASAHEFKGFQVLCSLSHFRADMMHGCLDATLYWILIAQARVT